MQDAAAESMLKTNVVLGLTCSSVVYPIRHVDLPLHSVRVKKFKEAKEPLILICVRIYIRS